MSLSSAARAPLPRPAGMPRGGTLHVVSGRPPLARGTAAFAVVCLGLLAAGLVALLLLNIALGRGSYTLHGLGGRVGELTDRGDSIRADLVYQRSAASLAQRALALGMVPARTAAFLRLSDGAVLGVASVGTRDTGFTVITRTEPPVKTPEQIAAERAKVAARKAAQEQAKKDAAAEAAAVAAAKRSAAAAQAAAAQKAAAQKAAAQKAAAQKAAAQKAKPGTVATTR
ncbi:MAG TPA: hypothetical protein VFJ97_10260 [Dermatophilaceae bacterium]|nr:hypothetical protein [Dermatophilaceae bacterium]